MASSLQLKPVSQSFSLKDHIHSVLRDAILEMHIYDEGTDLRLDERGVAEQLGISRTPVREALARLEQDGFVEIIPRRGVYVRRKSLAEILEMIIVWAALESMAARLATERLTDEDIDALRALTLSQSNTPDDYDEYSEANIRFHQKIIDLGGCQMIKDTTDGLFMHMHAVRRRAMSESNRAEHSVPDHLKIVDALAARDADLAGTLVREHTMRLHDHVETVWTVPEETEFREDVG